MPHTAIKPPTYPDFAVNDVVDPVSGQNNVIEPSSGKKDVGWDRHETPPRQHFNWIHRFVGLWVRYLDAAVDHIEGDITSLTQDVSGLTQDVNDLTQDVAGIQADIDAATSQNATSNLVERDANGRYEVVTPQNPAEVANKGYVDNAIAGSQAFSSGTRMLFFNAAAPTGWSIDAGANDRTVIIDSNNGNDTGGSWTISGHTIGDRTLNSFHMPSVANSYVIEDVGGPFPGPVSRDVGDGFSISLFGNSSPNAHDHAITHNGSWRPRHIKGIICQRD